MNRQEMLQHFEGLPTAEIELSAAEWQNVVGSLLVFAERARMAAHLDEHSETAKAIIGIAEKLKPYMDARTITICLS